MCRHRSMSLNNENICEDKIAVCEKIEGPRRGNFGFELSVLESVRCPKNISAFVF